MPHLTLWACQLFLSWSLGVWVPIGFLVRHSLIKPFLSSHETSLGNSISVSISDSMKWECALVLTFLRQKCHFEKFPSLMVSVLRWQKFIFSSDYTINLEAHLQPELKKLVPFSWYFSMLRFDCAQLLGILYFTKWSNAALCLLWLMASCPPDLLQTLVSHLPRESL